MECSIKQEFKREAVQRTEVTAVGSSGEQLLEGKSRRQREKDLKQQRTEQLCVRFIESGSCKFGQGCKFSHDLDTYKQKKPPPIGPCIFNKSPCPYGVTCLFSHISDEAGDLPMDLPAAGPSAASHSLPPSDSIQPPVNVLPKDIQGKLWKGRYTFNRAEQVLSSLGLKDSRAKAKEGGESVDHQETKKKRTEPGSIPNEKLPDDDAEAAAGMRSEWIQQHVETFLRPEEKRTIDFRGKLYVAPLTTVGNLPFRRICKGLGADITIGEMALATNLIQGQASEWALMKRHPCEDLFGVQVAGGYPDTLSKVAQIIEETCSVDFVDLNMGCPIDIVCDRGAGSSLLLKPKRIEDITRAMSRSMDIPLTLKTRKGYYDSGDMAHSFIPSVRSWGAQAFTLHGRTRAQRYSSTADWSYITKCARLDPELQLIGNGDIFSYNDWNDHMRPQGGGGEGVEGQPLATCMIGRGCLIKPWILTEIKEQRDWDISASERFDLIKKFVSFGLEQWGSDARGVENCRRFLLEWLSYLCRYVPIGLLEVSSVSQHLSSRVPPYHGRDDLETLLGSDNPSDWVKISSMLLGPPPSGFTFTPKHKSNSTKTAGSSAQQNDHEAEG